MAGGAGGRGSVIGYGGGGGELRAAAAKAEAAPGRGSHADRGRIRGGNRDEK